jgi:serine/threonine protein kinase
MLMPRYGMALAEYLTYRRSIARQMQCSTPLFINEALQIWYQIIDAIQHCHKHQIVHRGNPFLAFVPFRLTIGTHATGP